jgi:hypothetical protein
MSFTVKFDVNTTIENLCSIKKILDQIKCDFYPAFGTFLGMYRDKNIISYDYDSDLIVFEAGYKLILKNLLKFEQEKFCIFRHDGGSILSFFRNNNYTDIYPFYFVNQMFQNGGYKLHPKHIAQVRYLIMFGTTWKVFDYPEEYFENCYGKDWKIPTTSKPAVNYGYV